ncbi:nucleotidyltransferase family protein [Pseudoxanthomonas sp.]|uniref:nucleotidyltransferase family protein n=1 Tax=Pseudoxanthomonas sp. TaxID=1871049 RepID=UPI00258CEB12|nr:nucleotidyltransferase family protein [Pseudoxanthomonas sp.]MCR6686675.1 nucleotidyltransferase family protein [Pseudoxanthomonas sp.]
MTTPHAAVVLAAGGSTRLGRPKQGLTRGDETLVHRTARLALASGAARVLVIVGARADSVCEAVRDLPVECHHNAAWATGLGSSVRVAAAALATHGGPALLLVCDQPALEDAHLHALLEAARASSSGCAATRLGQRLGTPVVVSPEVLRRAGALHGDRGLRDLLNAEGVDVAACDAPGLVLDIDTPEDLAVAVAKGWLDGQFPAGPRGGHGRAG